MGDELGFDLQDAREMLRLAWEAHEKHNNDQTMEYVMHCLQSVLNALTELEHSHENKKEEQT